MTIPSLFTYSSSPVSKWSRSLSDVNRSTAANNPRPSASFSVRKNPQCTRVNTPPVFPGLRPCTWPHLLRLVTKTMLDRLLATDIVSAAVRCRQHTTRRTRQLPRAGEARTDQTGLRRLIAHRGPGLPNLCRLVVGGHARPEPSLHITLGRDASASKTAIARGNLFIDLPSRPRADRRRNVFDCKTQYCECCPLTRAFEMGAPLLFDPRGQWSKPVEERFLLRCVFVLCDQPVVANLLEPLQLPFERRIWVSGRRRSLLLATVYPGSVQ